ncbi:MAG: ATP-dependent DNA ligase [Alphaproteobacteria bacterium]|nr:ATP-dependent DNA ligase [Alphaproteobacteria bacterium]MBV9418370.1 ATP-dependent DNA ligase [Alphaproteobacteria bacterium]
MEARIADALPRDGSWQYEPKWDGFRCLAFKRAGTVELRAKSGKSLTRYFPEVAAALAATKPKRFVLDGELVIPQGQVLSFDALQMRLHPAESRIRKLSVETPASLILFDMLEDADGEVLTEQPLRERREALETLFATLKQLSLKLSPYTRKLAEAKKWLSRAGGGALDGVVAKQLDGAYLCGERAMLKVKCLRTADCVIGGFRYATNSRQVGSLLLGLYNGDGQLDHVGFTSGISDTERPKLTAKVEKLRGGAGFTGDAPGGPSRWSTERSAEWVPLKPVLVAEVQYDHVTGDRFRHGTRFLRWRPDKAPKQCTFDQLKQEARVGKLLKAISAHRE